MKENLEKSWYTLKKRVFFDNLIVKITIKAYSHKTCTMFIDILFLYFVLNNYFTIHKNTNMV